MNQILDRSKLCESIRNVKAQDLLFLIVHPSDKKSNQTALDEVKKFCSGKSCELMVIRKR
jgi:hypothetical protein